jgi:DNA processing protein
MHTVRYTIEQDRCLFSSVPPDDLPDEPKNRGVLALAERLGPDLLSVIRSTPSYEYLLKTKFADRPPAVPIRNEGDCDVMVSILTQARSALLQKSKPRQLTQLYLPV